MPMLRRSTAERMPEKEKVLEMIIRSLNDGYAHGFFEYSIECTKDYQGSRIIVFKCGKTHRFTISEDEVSHHA